MSRAACIAALYVTPRPRSHFISASANAFIDYVIEKREKKARSGRGDREMPSTKAISPVRDCRRASERRGSSTLSSYSGALGRFTVTSGSRTKALISVPGRQVPNCRFKGVYPR